MLLLIDNYDSFTYNLVDYLSRLTDEEVRVVRNDTHSPEEIKALNPRAVIISPGPKTPSRAGISKKLIEEYHESLPLLGICLGHQAIAEVFGAKIIKAASPRHGKTSPVKYKADPLFEGISNPFECTRYHSLVVDKSTIPGSLEVIATSVDDNEIMALKHRVYPVYGLQFHPESILTKEGLKLLANFLSVADIEIKANVAGTGTLEI